MNAFLKHASVGFAELPHIDFDGDEHAVISALRENGVVGIVSQGQPSAVLLTPEMYEIVVSMVDAPSTDRSETESGFPDERKFVPSSTLLGRLRNE